LSPSVKSIAVRKYSILKGRALLAIIPLFYASCWDFNRRPIEPAPIREEAYVPVYGYDSSLRVVKNETPQPTLKAGKIYVFGSYLFQVEENAGIHIIDYRDKTKPVKVSFIKSVGCSELAVKNGLLITNNMNDLVTVNISDFQSVKEVSRIKKAFKNYYFNWYDGFKKPPERGKYFVCPHFDKGDVIDWKLEKKVADANCYNN
jgi:hypothetical protein